MSTDHAAVVREFNTAFNRHDVEAMLDLMTEDCVFENTHPAPSGTRIEGRASNREFWHAFFRDAPQAAIEIEEMVVVGARGFQRWTYRWERERGFVRGVDVFRFSAGRIAEKLSYVKG